MEARKCCTGHVLRKHGVWTDFLKRAVWWDTVEGVFGQHCGRFRKSRRAFECFDLSSRVKLVTFGDNRLRVGGDQDFSFRASLEWQALKADCKFQAIRATKAVFSVSPTWLWGDCLTDTGVSYPWAWYLDSDIWVQKSRIWRKEEVIKSLGAFKVFSI